MSVRLQISSPAVAVTLPSRTVLCLVVLAGLGVGAVLAAGAAPMREPALVTLLRFMAVVKAAMVLGAVLTAAWRLRSVTGSGTVIAYAAAAGVMAAGPAPIWTGAHVAAGAVLVHVGLAAFMVTAWRDRAGWLVMRRKTGPFI